MSGVAIETSNKSPIGFRRQLAWQLSLSLPLLVLIVCYAAGYTPTHLWQTACGVLLLTLVSVSAVTDMIWCKIPNWATYSAFAWGIIINVFASLVGTELSLTFGAVGLAESLAGAFVPFFFMLLIFSMTGGGAGDVKLTAAMGALLGLNRVIDAILMSFIFAGGFALMRAVWILGPVQLYQLVFRSIGSWLFPLWIQSPDKEQSAFMRQPMPLGPSFALGAGMVLFDFNVQQLIEGLGAFGNQVIP